MKNNITLVAMNIKLKISISVVFIFIFFNSYSQEQVETFDNPAFLASVQGTWIYDSPGDWWHKAVIKGNYISLYNAKPSKGRWNDSREGNNENVVLEVTSSYKVVKKGRSNYDGKPYTITYSILTTRRIDNGNNHKGPFFSMSEGKLTQWGLDSQDNSNANPQKPTVVFRRVPNNYNPWQ